MTEIQFTQFDKLYQNTVEEIFTLWTPDMQKKLSAHNVLWQEDNFNFKLYLKKSSIRYYLAYRSFKDTLEYSKICDIGGFWGAFPLTLKKLGFNVTMTECLQYYDSSFDRLFELISDQGVRIIDFDPFKPSNALPEKFDVLTIMAVIEHYPYSLKFFMENCLSMLDERGEVYIEVPNIAYLAKRFQLLSGKTPLVSVKDIYESEIPFTGHHHEFISSELDSLTQLSGLTVISKKTHNYWKQNVGLISYFYYPVEDLINLIFPNTRQCIAVTAKKVHVATNL